jgi:hypothetical protein
MSNPSDREPLKITLEDLASVVVPDLSAVSGVPNSPGAKSYGTINEAAEQFSPVSEEKGSVFLQGWFYLGLAGLLGAVAGWAIAEPGFVDAAAGRWGNLWLLPIIMMKMCVGFEIAQNTIER